MTEHMTSTAPDPSAPAPATSAPGATDPSGAPLLSIVYASAARDRFSADDLADLLARSRATNEAHALTGLLMHRDGRFLQLIEGPEDQVRARMRAIEGDGRHGGIRVLLEDEIDARRFPDWTMGYEAPGGGAADVPGFRRTFDDIDEDRSTSGTLPALRALLAWFRERHDA